MDVSDSASHRRDQIANFAEILRKAPARQRVFNAIYYGKKQYKTIKEVARTTGFTTKRVATIARPLARGHKLFEQSRLKIGAVTETAYKKIDFVTTNKRKILSLANNARKLDSYHTKSNPKGVSSSQRITIRVPFKVKVKFFRSDDVKEFARVKRITAKTALSPARIPESKMKRAIVKLLGEAHVPKDWGGETNDIFTTITIFGKRRRAAFALKGPAKTGPLVPKMMGKNGDQIQRLFSSPAEAFVVQYEGEVKESVYKLMEELAKARAITTAGTVFWCVIDNEATKKLRLAYPAAFK